MPETRRNRVIELSCESNQGIVKTKSPLREKFWFPGIDHLVDNVVKHCIPCQASTAKEQLEPYKMSTLQRGPWGKVSIDLVDHIRMANIFSLLFSLRIFSLS